jgi:riboflavin synthase alpha subunit
MLAGLNVGQSISIGGLTVTVCAIMEDEETDLDYAIVNVFRNELSST